MNVFVQIGSHRLLCVLISPFGWDVVLKMFVGFVTHSGLFVICNSFTLWFHAAYFYLDFPMYRICESIRKGDKGRDSNTDSKFKKVVL